MYASRLCSRLFHAPKQTRTAAVKNVCQISMFQRRTLCKFDRQLSTRKEDICLRFQSPRLSAGQRCFSSKQKKEREIPSNVMTLEDIGDTIFDKHPSTSQTPLPRDDNDHATSSETRRVKVKMNWKNSLVTADSLNLFENLFQTYPQLIEFPEGDLLRYIELMSSYAIDVDKAAEMVIIYPSLLHVTPEKLNSLISTLQSIGVSERKRKHLLRRCPQLFDMNPKDIGKHFSFLKTYLSVDETLEALETSVEILLESENTLKRKLDYLIKDMSHEAKYIVSCKALCYPLRHIKTRHEFLVRAGFFKPIPYSKFIKVMEKEYKDRNKPRAKYFKPLLVVCYKDEDFLKACTNNLITLNEFVAFEELYSAELDVEEEEEDMEEEDEDNKRDFEEEDEMKDAVSLIRSPNSVGFLSNVESKSCYF